MTGLIAAIQRRAAEVNTLSSAMSEGRRKNGFKNKTKQHSPHESRWGFEREHLKSTCVGFHNNDRKKQTTRRLQHVMRGKKVKIPVKKKQVIKQLPYGSGTSASPPPSPDILIRIDCGIDMRVDQCLVIIPKGAP